MKKILFSLLLILPAFALGQEPGHGFHRRPAAHTGAMHKAAHDLVDAVEALDAEAFERADEMSEGRRDRGIRELDEVSDAASLLARALRRQVLREMHDKGGHDRFGRTLRRIEDNEYRNLQRAVDNLNRGGFGVQMAVSKVETSWRDLERSIRDDFGHHHGGGGPGIIVSGSCTGKFGGNFFNKLSHVECLVSGFGLVRYEVEFRNPQTGQFQTVQGILDEKLKSQSFASPKASVGRNANFTTYVVNRRGERTQIAQGRCEGNPF